MSKRTWGFMEQQILEATFPARIVGLGLALAAAIGFAILTAATAHGAEPEKKPETLRDSTAGVLVVIQDGQELGLVFISKTGQILPESVGACEAKEECGTLMKKLHDEQHMTVIQLPSARAADPKGSAST